MTTTLQDLKPSEIKPHKLNPRHDVGDVTELAASIKEKGIVEPLIVAPNTDGAGYVLIAGHRRHAAARSIRLKTVPCLVRDDLTDPKAQIEVMLVENLQRSDLTPVEEAESYQQLLSFPGYTQKRIAETTGRPVATVRARLKIGKLPKNALERVHRGQISISDALGLADIEGEPEFDDLAKAAGTSDFGWRLQVAKDAKRNRAARLKARDRLEAEGVRIVERSYTSRQMSLYGDDEAEQLFPGKSLSMLRHPVDDQFPDVRELVAKVMLVGAGDDLSSLTVSGAATSLFSQASAVYGQPLVVDAPPTSRGSMLVSCGESFLGLLPQQRVDTDAEAQARAWRDAWTRRLAMTS